MRQYPSPRWASQPRRCSNELSWTSKPPSMQHITSRAVQRQGRTAAGCEGKAPAGCEGRPRPSVRTWVSRTLHARARSATALPVHAPHYWVCGHGNIWHTDVTQGVFVGLQQLQRLPIQHSKSIEIFLRAGMRAVGLGLHTVAVSAASGTRTRTGTVTCGLNGSE